MVCDTKFGLHIEAENEKDQEAINTRSAVFYNPHVAIVKMFIGMNVYYCHSSKSECYCDKSRRARVLA